MSDKSACPDDSLTCEAPVSLTCSFKGCPPLPAHDASYDVKQFGGVENSLRKSQARLVCVEGPPVIEVEYNIEGANKKFSMEPCTTPGEHKLSLTEADGFLGLDSYTCAGVLNPTTETCFTPKYADCELDSVAFIDGDCRTECLKYTLDSSGSSSGSGNSWSGKRKKRNSESGVGKTGNRPGGSGSSQGGSGSSQSGSGNSQSGSGSSQGGSGSSQGGSGSSQSGSGSSQSGSGSSQGGSGTLSDKTFIWRDQGQKFLASNYEDYKALLLAENWLDSSFQESTSLQLQCSDSQEWSFVSTNPGYVNCN